MAFLPWAAPASDLTSPPADCPLPPTAPDAIPPAPDAGTLRVATYGAALSRRGPGLLLRDIEKQSPETEAALRVIAAARADVLLLTGIDWDDGGWALTALVARLGEMGRDYPFRFAPRPNTGVPTGLDIDGNGRLDEARDAQGYGRFTGDGGMALLSRWPIDAEASRDFSAFLWRDLPGALIDGAALPEGAAEIQRLSSAGHWDVALRTPAGRLHLWAWAATPPLFDGPEDRNGRRNHDEAAFWLRYLDGDLPQRPAPEPFVLLGNANLDPGDGTGRPAALAALLADPRLRDPRPGSPGALAAARRAEMPQSSAPESGTPACATVDWGAPRRPGFNRVDLVLPSAGLRVVQAGVLWPADTAGAAPSESRSEAAEIAPRRGPETTTKVNNESGFLKGWAKTVALAGRHRLVWVDISLH
ncbi:endonuclease/exonuclease/phosphatase family protein [Phaeovulum vinaykumarii]|uniref:Endonuclease/Exonuclease/phosphatase family protein n=1 Tax=Phaeovulum vinaykumarii TaxID=407234 RepID=A0A1N7L282_9RHOB|nr:endonuclease/exonuclease/phosphatase family protein [Phaeovulum vinaykumarii]SIS67972.1 Endonuclease/Exonuclease/phosphatase family protein [Phaeovulum vinaykumarii]SOC00438.1 endonuclease/exonuclease/phosphatase family protein [Phaeovulum vinaykumarii]